MFSTLPSHFVDYDRDPASPGTLYNAFYTGLQATVSRSNSPQSSNGSPVCTPYQNGRSITDSSCGESSFGYVSLDACPIKPVEGLGIHIPELPNSSPLRPLSEPAPEMLSDFGAIPFSVGYNQGAQNNDMSWQDTGFPRVADSHYNGVYTQTHHPRHTRAHSSSNRGAGTSISPLHFLPDSVDLFGVNRPGNIRSSVSRSFSQPPDSYVHPSQESWGRDSHSAMPGQPACSSQWVSPMEDYKPVSSTPRNDSERSSLFQPRVGSDRTRAISRSRRSNPYKKLLHCPISGCGATLTSRHNFKSHTNSHFGIKPHACGQGQCNKRFGTTAEVKRHRANHCQYRS